jgi:hypothetical protein
MRPIHVTRLDTSRPVLVLTRELIPPHMNTVTVAPITTTTGGLSPELPLGTANGSSRAAERRAEAPRSRGAEEPEAQTVRSSDASSVAWTQLIQASSSQSPSRTSAR